MTTSIAQSAKNILCRHGFKVGRLAGSNYRSSTRIEKPGILVRVSPQSDSLLILSHTHGENQDVRKAVELLKCRGFEVEAAYGY